MVEVGKKYNKRTLFRMKQFYIVFSKEKVSLSATQLSWSHYIELLSIKDTDEILYYINQCMKQKLTRNELRDRIKNKEYERLPATTKNKFIMVEQTKIEDLIKNPIIIKNSNNYKEISEKVLKKLILEDIENFMKELGNSFCFIGSEYKIKLGNRYNYIDLLLFNYEYNCFVVVEMKVTELKKEHIGQIQVYMNYIDNHLRNTRQNKTIGIIICKKDNQYIIEYCSDERIVTRGYILL